MAAITPPEGPEEPFAPPFRRESAEVVPLILVVLPETGLWRTGLDVSGIVVEEEIGVGDDDDDDDDDDDGVPVTVGSVDVELGTRPERDDPSGTTSVAIDVKVSTTVNGVGGSPMSDAGALVTTVVGTRTVVRRVRLSLLSSS
jgi:hypothetical protein